MDQYEQAKAEADALAAAEAQVDPALATPAPERFAADRVRLEQLIIGGLPEDLRADWDAGRLRYRLGDFDEHGWGKVEVLDPFGREVAGARCHWSAIAAKP
jgi:hypothetical protein